MTQGDRHPNPLTLWRHRRRHSYAALIGSLGLTALLVAAEIWRPGTVEGLEPMIGPAYTFFGLVVLAYISNCAIEAWIDRRQ